MDIAIKAALIAASVSVLVTLISTFLGDSYKRFHEGSGIAAGIAGELASHQAAIPILQTNLTMLAERFAQVGRQGIALRSIERPRDLFYEAIIGKLGLLGTGLLEDVVFVYGQIAGMRTSLALLAENSDQMGDAEMRSHLEMALQFIERAEQRGEPLLGRLRRRAAAWYVPYRSARRY